MILPGPFPKSPNTPKRNNLSLRKNARRLSCRRAFLYCYSISPDFYFCGLQQPALPLPVYRSMRIHHRLHFWAMSSAIHPRCLPHLRWPVHPAHRSAVPEWKYSRSKPALRCRHSVRSLRAPRCPDLHWSEHMPDPLRPGSLPIRWSLHSYAPTVPLRSARCSPAVPHPRGRWLLRNHSAPPVLPYPLCSP